MILVLPDIVQLTSFWIGVIALKSSERQIFLIQSPAYSAPLKQVYNRFMFTQNEVGMISQNRETVPTN